MKDIEELLKSPQFSKLEPGRKEAFKALAERLKGKNQMEMMGEIIRFGKAFPDGRDIPPDEQAEMINAYIETLPASEQDKLNSIFKLFLAQN